jgi:selenide,water dikinase
VRLSADEEELLFDPQTSGGLLLAVPAGQADGLVSALHASGVTTAVRVGEVADSSRPLVTVG